MSQPAQDPRPVAPPPAESMPAAAPIAEVLIDANKRDDMFHAMDGNGNVRR